MHTKLTYPNKADQIRLAELDMAIARLEYRQARQSAWILVLIIAVVVLGGAIVALTLL